jgi:hypothetical protein
MFSVVSFVFFMGAALLAYLSNMLYAWELIFVFVLCVPIYWYTKRDKHVYGFLFATQTISIVTRFLVCARITALLDLETPISIETSIIRQFSGVVSILSWLVWLTYVGIVNIQTAKAQVAKLNDMDTVNRDKTMIRATNLFSTTGVTVIVLLMVSLQAFNLNNYVLNIMLFEVIVVCAAIGVYMMQATIIRKRKEEIAVSDMKAESVAVVCEDLTEEEEEKISPNINLNATDLKKHF